MGIGGSHEAKEEDKGPSKHIFSPVGSPPVLDFFPHTGKEHGQRRSEAVIWSGPTEPVVFRWHHKGRERVPREVLLHGSWDDRTVRLVPDGEPANASNPERAPRRPVAASDEETIFITIIDLPPGTYSYDFTVDGKVCLAPDQPIVNSRNSITVVPSESYSKPLSSNNDEEGWGQEIPDLSENPAAPSPQKTPARKSRNQGPVELPAHLERALLNSQPVADDPSMLPLPHHVMLNHLYSRPSLYNTYILGLTVRHRENFVTVVLYKPTEPAAPEVAVAQ